METLLSSTSWPTSSSTPLLLIGLAAACGGLLIGIAVGRRLRAAKRSAAEAQRDNHTLPSDMHLPESLTDRLTGLADHRALDAQLCRRIDQFQLDPEPFCLLLLDVDHFKKFDDIHDHLAGDDALRMIGRLLKTQARATDFIARYSSEEFAIIMPDTRLDAAVATAHRIRAAVEQAMSNFGGRKLKMTVCIGVAEVAAGQTPATLMRRADEALYSAKQSGRNQVHYDCDTAKKSSAPDAIDNSDGHDSTQPASATAKPAQRMLKHFSPLTETRTDPQTGLPNRTAFCEEIRRRLSEAQRHGNRLSLILAKIDNLSDTIRQRSQQDTDLMLRTCAQFFTAAMRDMDLVVRYDTDIFGIMLPGTALVNTTGVGQRLRTTIQKSPLRLRESEIHFTLSAGVAEAQPGEDLTAFLNRVEAATAMAVADGGDSVRFHNGIAVEPIAQQEEELSVV
jgi:diguanylate cyclase (GGDEF)-like protein